MKMNIDTSLLKKLRADKLWSQEQLGNACGLSLRTIQRIENTGVASIESVRSLASVFEISPDELVRNGQSNSLTLVEAVKKCLTHYADFSGTATRAEFWWFILFVLLIMAVSTIINDSLYQIAGLLFVLPLLAAGTRRLRNTKRSGWWQLLYLVPFGVVVVFFLLVQEYDLENDQHHESA